jgi:hypothetical protein
MKLSIKCALMTCMLVQQASAQNLSKTKYLAAHAVSWDGPIKNAEAALTPEILNSQIIMIGEGHGIARSYEIQTDLIKYLKKKIGFKYLLQELGYCDGLLLNNYLHTGDEAKLNEFFAAHRGTFYWNKNIKEFYHHLYALNKGLAEKNKIIILPVDIEHNYRAGIKYLQSVLFTGELKLSGVGKKLQEIDAEKWTGREIVPVYQEAYSEFKKDCAAYRIKAGHSFDDIAYLMRNINETLSMALSGSGKRRDTVMLQNFMYYKAHLHFKNKKMVGMFGTYHIRQADKADEGHFAALLKKAGAVSSITSAMLCYSGGYIMMPKGYTAAQMDTAKVLYKIVENTYPYIVESLEDGDLLAPYRKKHKGWIFNIAASGSPFKDSKSFLVADDQFADINALYQLVILVNDSPAAQPIISN